MSKGGYAKKTRNSKLRRQKAILLINAEGKNKTEVNYFKRFNSDSVSVVSCKGNYTDPVNMTKRLLAEYDANGLRANDFAVCLVDTDFDNAKDEQIKVADKMIADRGKSNIRLYTSSPCFEIWFICHYERCTTQFANNGEVIERLQTHMGDYSKNSTDIYEKLKGRESVAIKNAKMLEQKCVESGRLPHTVNFRNSTEIYKLFEGGAILAI